MAPPARLRSSPVLLDLPASPCPADLPSNTPDPSRLLGEHLGDYLVAGYLGSGTSARVYYAHSRRLGIPVALKLILLREAERDARERCRRESQVLARLNHPNVLRIWDAEFLPNYCYIALEYVSGCTAEDLLRSSGRLRPDRAVRIIQAALVGLMAAWELGVIHRDIKPANLLIARDSTVKVADLGLAALSAQPSSGWQLPEGFAPQRRLVGTPAYLPPEQAQTPDQIDHRADIYGLGATLYHLLTERLPFGGKNSRDAILHHLRTPLTPPSQWVPDLPSGLVEVVMRMMAKNPDDRYADGKELLVALAPYTAENSRRPNPLSMEETRELTETVVTSPPPECSIPAESPKATTAKALVHQTRADQLTPPPSSLKTRRQGIFRTPPASNPLPRSVSTRPQSQTEVPTDARTQLQAILDGMFLEQVDQTIASLHQLAAEYPQFSEVWLWLGRLAEDANEAMVYLQCVLELEPDHPIASRSLRALQSTLAPVEVANSR